MGRPAKIQDIEELFRLRSEGYTVRALANHFEVGVATIQRVLQSRKPKNEHESSTDPECS